ncbi:hypothetical protein B0H21DRAFT_747340, partial [Amylocystis lapponica]
MVSEATAFLIIGLHLSVHCSQALTPCGAVLWSRYAVICRAVNHRSRRPPRFMDALQRWLNLNTALNLWQCPGRKSDWESGGAHQSFVVISRTSTEWARNSPVPGTCSRFLMRPRHGSCTRTAPAHNI